MEMDSLPVRVLSSCGIHSAGSSAFIRVPVNNGPRLRETLGERSNPGFGDLRFRFIFAAERSATVHAAGGRSASRT